jgi:hypothetical protein
MPRCHTCHNEYDKTMEIKKEGRSYIFDSFECAIHALAPKCHHCECRVMGHGVEQDGVIFCCASCARETGASVLRDRADDARGEVPAVP